MQTIEIVDKLTGDYVSLSENLDMLYPRDAQAAELRIYPDIDPLTVSRNIVDSRGYTYLGVPFPSSSILVNANPSIAGIAPNAQIDGVITVPEGSLLISIVCTSLQPSGFQVRLYDKQIEQDIFYGEFASNWIIGTWDMNPLCDTPVNPVNTGIPIDAVGVPNFTGQMFVPSAYPMIGAGILNVSITNLANAYNICQILVNFAVPTSYSGVMLQATTTENN